MVDGTVTISTWRQSSLLLDISKYTVSHRTIDPSNAWDIPVELEISGSIAKLFATIGNTKFYIAASAHGELGVCGISAGYPETATVFEIRLEKDGRLAIHHDGKYLCAEPSERIICNRTSANVWEKFQFNIHL